MFNLDNYNFRDDIKNSLEETIKYFERSGKPNDRNLIERLRDLENTRQESKS